VDAFMCYKQKCKVVSLNLAHPVYTLFTILCDIAACFRPRLCCLVLEETASCIYITEHECWAYSTRENVVSSPLWTRRDCCDPVGRDL